MYNIDEIKVKLKKAIIDELQLDDISFEDINDAEPIFGEGIGLDSLDAVELVVLVQRHFNIVMKDVDEAKKAFVSINSLAEYIVHKQQA
ncbi:phosphopantetheine-binding protein [Desulfovibrio litoralis]|uniref:Acyl carrier protein n=1 Tax=Desulfovibrio litoralis DSM 11393 TaxID=1121455 RepID=A0A1M7STK8_9BACT|nr:phosphopantetheine-binding protein [Desulfovibrio litoralis]SHN61903.1 acyl carrier protein [Desulfovibrio litoralis DSM 11393]